MAPSGSGTVSAMFNSVEANNNGDVGIYLYGINMLGTLKGTVADSVASGNSIGVEALTAYGTPTTLVLSHSVAAYNNTGVVSSGTDAVVRMAQSMVTGNPTAAWQAVNTGVVQSYGDNYIDDNGTSTGALVSYATR